jgi:hypothetical protein
MLMIVSVLITRFWWLLYPALGFLGYVGYHIHRTMQQQPKQHHTIPTLLYYYSSPIIMTIGLLLMYNGRRYIFSLKYPMIHYTYTFWYGESLVITMFIYNSIPVDWIVQQSQNDTRIFGIITCMILLFSSIVSLCLHGAIWNYIIVLGMIIGLGLLVALTFPLMELVLETILNEKLKLIGEKIRIHHTFMKTYYENKYNKNSINNKNTTTTTTINPPKKTR